ncbi:hypothetical protein B0T18DRAFT_431664 [Schizothecium vesticola]|uniref:Dienelactone hydrolase n=1 Tax=Schizothecium vesticola TaxID=314040 RepID=A0AA40EJ81_9PEZI|nr:hypothetical protein B0T18DRAFT_431664 [Schizothecium vesticola]
MNVNLPNLINATLDRYDDRHASGADEGESTHTSANGTLHRKHRNVAILSDNWTGGSMNHNDPSFLSSSFPRNPPKLFLASDDADPDPAVLAAWRAEGFNVVAHLPLGLDADPTATLRDLHRRAGLAPCETYGVVAFGEAAARCLEHFHVLDNNPELKLGLVVAYYPTRIPDPRTRFPSAVRGVVVHLALAEGHVGVVKQRKLEDQDLGDTMAVFSAQTEPSVTYVPTCTGGTGMDELEEFYSEYFLDDNPPSLDTTLLSRTVGTDRVVDEVFVTFKHSQEMPWILPGVPPTNKRVEIAMVSIVSFKGGKIQHEHVYWDQASVLMQVGLLNPKLVPQAGKKIGVERLPVLGKTAARRVFGSASGVQDVEANGLLYALEDSDDEGKRAQRQEKVQANGQAEKPKTLVERPKESERQSGRVVEVISEEEENEKEGSEKEEGEKGAEEKEAEEEEDEVQQQQTEGLNGEHMKKTGEEKRDGEQDGAKKNSGKKRGEKKKNEKQEEDSQAASTNNGFGSIS